MTGENEQKLRDEGMIANPELPREYSEFIESLDEGEVDALISITRKALDAGIPMDDVTGKAGVPL